MISRYAGLSSTRRLFDAILARFFFTPPEVLEGFPMKKIASPQELVSELKGILDYSQSGSPSREKLASALNGLARRVEAASGMTLSQRFKQVQDLYLKELLGEVAADLRKNAGQESSVTANLK